MMLYLKGNKERAITSILRFENSEWLHIYGKLLLASKCTVIPLAEDVFGSKRSGRPDHLLSEIKKSVR